MFPHGLGMALNQRAYDIKSVISGRINDIIRFTQPVSLPQQTGEPHKYNYTPTMTSRWRKLSRESAGGLHTQTHIGIYRKIESKRCGSRLFAFKCSLICGMCDVYRGPEQSGKYFYALLSAGWRVFAGVHSLEEQS